MQKTDYQIINKNNSRKLTEFLCREGQLLLPMVELITQAEMAVDKVIEVTGRAAIEAVLTLSAWACFFAGDLVFPGQPDAARMASRSGLTPSSIATPATR
jgi:hypothetical protein